MIKEFLVRFRKQIFFALVVVACSLGASFALRTVDRYKIIVDAVLGLTVLFELYADFQLIKKAPNEPEGIHVELPRDLKYVAHAFFVTVIGIWAGSQILPLLWSLIGFIKR